jgi:hypothetical protein
MKAPFSADQFFDVFRQYNEAIFPFHILLLALAVSTTLMAVRPFPKSNRLISLILVFFWLWMGVIYHIGFFSRINPVAYGFGFSFIIQALLISYFGLVRNRILFACKRNAYGIAGLGMITYSLFIYPLLGIAGGHAYPEAPTFGLPCPTTIFTFGIFLMSVRKFPLVLLLIPFLWSVLGISAAYNFGVLEDWFLPISGIVTVILMIRKNRMSKHS